MSQADPLRHALDLPGGARFLRCALQVNPGHYAASYRGKGHGLDDQRYVEQLIATCIELGIEVLAITDHNHVGGVDLFRSEGRKHGVIVFPGFEVASSEGVHVLCIYPPDSSIEKLGRYLGEFGIRDLDPSSSLANKPFSDILECVRQQGGITIAAHVTQENGLLWVLKGQPRVNAWKDRNLLAVQIPGAVDDLPEDKRPIVLNQNPEYEREPGAGLRLAVSVVNAKDVARPEDLGDGAASCWIKMSEVSIEGLRQAFLDPQSRVRLASDPLPERHAEFAAIAWQGGFLDGAAVHLNENLNVLVGGRGTGKSTVIESLRYVLSLDPLGEEARRAHEGIVRYVLKSGTKVSLLVRSYSPALREYVVERTVPNPPVVRDDSGNVLPLAPKEVIPGVEVYGQHEISELAKSPEKLTRLLERFVERDPAVHRRKSELVRDLERSRRRIMDVQQELKQIEERLASLPALEETLKGFQEAGLEDRLKDQSLIVREERVIRTALERIAPFRQIGETLRKALPIDRAFVSAKALEALPGRAILADAGAALDRLEREVNSAGQLLETAVASAEAELKNVGSRWQVRKTDVQATYEKILRELQKSKVDGEEFIRLRRQIEELRPLRERQAALGRDEKEHSQHRKRLLAEWEDVKAEDFRQLERAAKKVSRQLVERVRVRVSYAGNREPLFVLLRDKVGGRLSEAIDTLKTRDALSLVEFAAACREGRDALAQKFDLTGAQADRLAQASPETIMLIEELDLAPTTTVELNVASEGQAASWQALEDLSTGQKATAILLLLLLESDAPLVVDQPEDDLDNRFITEGVVPKMREEKRRRQFVFATHNANIPVLGDAELIVGLVASGEAGTGQGRAAIPSNHMGSIDSRVVRELVEEVLEGGKAAFEMRRRKYGF